MLTQLRVQNMLVDGGMASVEFTPNDKAKLEEHEGILKNGLSAAYRRIERKVDENIARIEANGDAIADLKNTVVNYLENRRHTCPWHDIDSETERAVGAAMHRYKDEQREARERLAADTASELVHTKRSRRRQTLATWIAPVATAVLVALILRFVGG